jgi:SulP family sulfate permease
MPATGAIARTATNIRSGARSPVSGMLHAVFVLAFMLTLGPLASYIPLAALAAILVIVAWNMSEIDKFRYLMTAPLGDRLVLIATFGLTVLVDLTVAIEVGVVLAAILFMHRMAETVELQRGMQILEADIDDFVLPTGEYSQRDALPPDVEVFQFHGPLFFGVATRLIEVLDTIAKPPRVFILRMRDVPLIDATGVGALRAFIKRCQAQGTAVIVTGVRAQPRRILQQMGFGPDSTGLRFAENFEAALKAAATPPAL